MTAWVVFGIVVAALAFTGACVVKWMDDAEYSPPRGNGRLISQTVTVYPQTGGTFLIECDCGDVTTVRANDMRGLAAALTERGHVCEEES